MAHGSIVANSSQPSRRWLPRAAPASRRATISAWAVGSESARLRLPPRPTILPSHTTTAPTGTSPASSARCAERRASSINSSSLVASPVGEGISVPLTCLLHRMPLQHRREQWQVRAQRLIYKDIFSGALRQQVAGIRRQAGERVLAEFFRNKNEYPLVTAPEGGELFIVQKRGRHVGIVRTDFKVGPKTPVVNPYMAVSVEGNARARIEIAILHDLVLGTQVGKDGVGQRARGHARLEPLESPVGGKEKQGHGECQGERGGEVLAAPTQQPRSAKSNDKDEDGENRRTAQRGKSLRCQIENVRHREP